MPVSVSVNNYGESLRHWTTFSPGQVQSMTMVTGKRYGFCFSQPSGEHYRNVSGCGALTMYQYVNGVRAPNGATVAEQFSFPRSK